MSDIDARIQTTIDENKIVIFMKGSPSFPMCGFSAQTIEVFNALVGIGNTIAIAIRIPVAFESFDAVEDAIVIAVWVVEAIYFVAL